MFYKYSSLKYKQSICFHYVLDFHFNREEHELIADPFSHFQCSKLRRVLHESAHVVAHYKQRIWQLHLGLVRTKQFYVTIFCDNFFLTVWTRKKDVWKIDVRNILCDKYMWRQTGILAFMWHIKIVIYDYLIVWTSHHIKCDKYLE